MKMAIAKIERDSERSYESAGAPKPVKIAKKASLTLRVTLNRIDNLIEEVHSTVEPEQRAELVGLLMSMRMQVHSMIDEAIRFKNASQKSLR
jgi:ParB family chromosome partitioning protein